jgi:hypothetical protein
VNLRKDHYRDRSTTFFSTTSTTRLVTTVRTAKVARPERPGAPNPQNYRLQVSRGACPARLGRGSCADVVKARRRGSTSPRSACDGLKNGDRFCLIVAPRAHCSSFFSTTRRYGHVSERVTENDKHKNNSKRWITRLVCR